MEVSQVQLAAPGAILTLCLSTQAYIATKSEMEQHMRPSELSHPVPLSFEPVKNFFKTFMEAIRDTLQTPMETRLKESELPNESGDKAHMEGRVCLAPTCSPSR